MRKITNLAKSGFPQPDVVTAPVPVPTEGWDQISPLAAMDPKRAPILTNWVPRPGWVELRAGFQPWALLPGSSAVETLIVFNSPTGADKMFAATNNAFYDVTTSSAPVTPVASGFSSNRWQQTTITPALGDTYIQLVNGQDAMQMYDGITNSWTVPSISGLPGGASTSSIINIYAQKRRLWYIIKNTSIAAFMPTDAISGPIAGTQDFGALWNKGGFLVAMADWTSDGGVGPQDYAVFISSNGQATVYAGTDPTNANAWQLVGTFDLAEPIGYRCMTRVGSDIAVITTQGVLPFSQALPFDPSADRSSAITARIQNAMAQSAMEAKLNFGWEFTSYPGEQLFFLNIPQTTNSQQVQYVQNALTGAWCQFTGWNANTFAVFNDSLYFGDNASGVQLAYSGGQDGNNSITADLQCAFNWFDDPGRTKRMTMIQPLIIASGNVSPSLSVDADFSDTAPTAPVTVLAGGALWDEATWDVSTWPAAATTQTLWYSSEVVGHALAVRMQVNIAASTGNLTLGEFDLTVFDTAVFDGGGNGNAPLLQLNAFNVILELGGFI